MIVEIRTYRIVPGEIDEFVRVMMSESIPLIEAAGIRVCAAGKSLVREEGHDEAYLIRAFDSFEQHRAQEDAFYSSEAWLMGPRRAIVSRIESAHSVTLEVSTEVVIRALTTMS
ncbi:NIPSNAP family protein [Klugiella xanthotipulae]|uniref:NIPSNAP protein n=1 Tax=Klugiella xanthotipulae TaxID=244735 RepID=A0A543HT50_9MICO|nr:NIPSNAP family protein [Klugiella xanthotipulae]TQM61533.1 NIPSNAP protein [Klugiella xanthotipulae]